MTTRIWQEVGNGYPSCAEMYVSRGQVGPGIAALFVDGDPNGVVAGVRGQLAIDRATMNAYQNTDNGTTWVSFTGGGGSGVFQTLRFSPMAPDPFGPGANMPPGIIDNYTDPSLQTHTFLWFKGADNQATRLSGIDATGLVDGDVRLFLNIPDPVSGIDASQVVLLDSLNPDAAGSLAANQFIAPGRKNYTVPYGGHVWLIRAPTFPGSLVSCWHIMGQNAWSQQAVIQSLNFYPNLQASNPGAPLGGNLNDWNPAGEGPYGVGPANGIAGSDMRFNDHTVIRCFTNVDNSAKVTGMLVQPISDGPVAYGPVKVLVNEGPGTLTIAHLSALSAVDNRIYCPNERDLIVPVNGAVWLMHMYPNLPDAPIQWRVLGLGNEVFPTVNTNGATTTRGLAVQPQRSVPALLPAPIVSSDVPLGKDPGTVEILCSAPGSVLGGMEPDVLVAGAPVGTMVLLRNNSNDPLIVRDQDLASTLGNRFVLPDSRPLVIPPLGCAWFRYDEGTVWRLVGDGNVNRLPSNPGFIVPAAFPGAAVNDYAPTDAVSGMPGRYVYRWKVQGAVGTLLTGIDAAPAGVPGYADGDRILLQNFASGMTLKHFDAGSAAGNRFYLPGGVDLVLPTLGSVEVMRDQANGVWMVVGGGY